VDNEESLAHSGLVVPWKKNHLQRLFGEKLLGSVEISGVLSLYWSPACHLPISILLKIYQRSSVERGALPQKIEMFQLLFLASPYS
jgi:hypothetical protein